MMIGLIVRSLRPRQWTKNILLFAGLLFSKNLFDAHLFFKAFVGFVLFCALSGAVYLINDILDREQDRVHPVKSKRPLASGRLPVFWAAVAGLVIAVSAISASFLLNPGFGWVAAGYVALMLGYTWAFKKIVVLDVLVVSIGFVLRAAAGAEAIGVSISSWLLVCTIFLALFLSLCKRRHELVILGEHAAAHRSILGQYTPYLLDQMIAVVTASTVMAYALYTMSAETVENFGTKRLVFTIPFVLYGIFRYLYLVHQKHLGGSPEQILLKDRSMIINILFYLLAVGSVVYLK